jgi:flagellar motor switch protein FliG
MQSDVAYCMATMEDVSEEVLERAEQAIYRMFSRLARGTQGVGGPKVVADVLNMTGSSVEKNVLDSMDAQDPKIAESVRN